MPNLGDIPEEAEANECEKLTVQPTTQPAAYHQNLPESDAIEIHRNLTNYFLPKFDEFSAGRTAR